MLIKIIPSFHAGTLRRPIGLGFQLIVRIQSFSSDINEACDTLTSALITSAEKHIPVSSGGTSHKPVPYWTDECDAIIAARNKAHHKFEKSRLVRDNIQYNICKAHVKRTILTSKQCCWRCFCATLNHQTSHGLPRSSGRWSSADRKHFLKAIRSNIIVLEIAPNVWPPNYGSPISPQE